MVDGVPYPDPVDPSLIGLLDSCPDPDSYYFIKDSKKFLKKVKFFL